jgi:tetratricopeptide (TPR) repeat protein
MLLSQYRSGGGDRPADEQEPAVSATRHAAVPAGPVVVPRQLPAAAGALVGREAELGVLDRLLDAPGAGREAVVVSVLSGTAGVGKTALALHWAHRVADHFPDGQLYASLRGYDASARAVAPAEVIRSFLDTLLPGPERIPRDREAQAGLYRTLLTGKRMLIVLDNARDSAQVSPLLPGSPHCVTIVTSRSQLSGLVAASGARLLVLDALAAPEARRLLARRIGARRVAAERTAADDISRLCACLPLALCVTAARAVSRPDLPLAGLAAELRDARHRLDALDLEESASVRAAFSWSYDNLRAAEARVFRLLSLHPGAEISVPAAASLAGLAAPAAGAALRQLVHSNLLTESPPGRYAFHDLLRAYALERARDDDRTGAIGRLLEHYLHTAHGAAAALGISHSLVTVGSPADAVTAETFGTRDAALHWFNAERATLVKLIELAAREGFDTYVWQLPEILRTFFVMNGRWDDLIAIHEAALEAGRRLGNANAEACGHFGLGYTYFEIGDYELAAAHQSQAAALFRRTGHVLGQAMASHSGGAVCWRQGRHREALELTEAALALCEPGDPVLRVIRARALNNSGLMRAELGDSAAAEVRCTQALELFREMGNSLGEAATWDTLGQIHLSNKENTEAINCFQQSVQLQRDIGNRYSVATTLANLADALAAAGNAPGARDAWKEALAILTEMRHPDAAEIARKLRSLGSLPVNCCFAHDGRIAGRIAG